MVLLTITSATKVAIEKYCSLHPNRGRDGTGENSDQLSTKTIGDPITHHTLIDISRRLVDESQKAGDAVARDWRLETLLKGSTIYQPPPPPRQQPTPEYRALMQRLREEEDQRQYQRMLNPATPQETFNQRFPRGSSSFGAGIDIGHNSQDIVDDVTYADVNRQMVLIINVLISIICTAVAVWMAARRWTVPARLGLSLSSSTIVAAAEVAIYMGYIRRIKDSKTKEKKLVEQKEVVNTWVIDSKSGTQQASGHDSIRFRKGRHR